MRWAIGLTCVERRFSTTLMRTLESLTEAGFENPRLFVDGVTAPLPHWMTRYELTVRGTPVKAFGNWVLTAHELMIRNPSADRYAIFQDDVVLSRNVRPYLDRCPLSDDCYWNLITYPFVHDVMPRGSRGWCVSPQGGKGAQGLVFTREGLTSLVTEPKFVRRNFDRSLNTHGRERGTVNIDGGLVEAAKRIGMRELVHVPGLIWHDHEEPSAIGHKKQPDVPWIGRDRDCLELLG